MMIPILTTKRATMMRAYTMETPFLGSIQTIASSFHFMIIPLTILIGATTALMMMNMRATSPPILKTFQRTRLALLTTFMWIQRAAALITHLQGNRQNSSHLHQQPSSLSAS